jgi:plastocyanin
MSRRTACRLMLILAFAGSLSMAWAKFSNAAETPATATVKIENFTFNPAELTVKPGTMVTFENADDIPHSVVEKGAKFKSKPLDTGETFQMTFADAGEISYFCGFHPHMVGKIIVKP